MTWAICKATLSATGSASATACPVKANDPPTASAAPPASHHPSRGLMDAYQYVFAANAAAASCTIHPVPHAVSATTMRNDSHEMPSSMPKMAYVCA